MKRVVLNIHLFDLKAIKSTSRNKVTLSVVSEKETVPIELESTTTPQFIQALRESYQKITFGFPQDSLFSVELHSESELPLAHLPNDMVAAGFVRSYAAYCSYFDTFISPSFVQFITDLGDCKNTSLDFDECAELGKKYREMRE